MALLSYLLGKLDIHENSGFTKLAFVVFAFALILAIGIWQIWESETVTEKTFVAIEDNNFDTQLLKIASIAKSLEGSVEPYDVNEAINKALTPEGIELAIKRGLIFRHDGKLYLAL